jgi:hypothetical protein
VGAQVSEPCLLRAVPERWIALTEAIDAVNTLPSYVYDLPQVSIPRAVGVAEEDELRRQRLIIEIGRWFKDDEAGKVDV